jgi:hypothetical protein
MLDRSLMGPIEAVALDFLITRDRKPWLPVEAKLDERVPSASWRRYLSQLSCKRGLQLIRSPGVWRVFADGESRVLVASAGEALRHFC